MVHLDGLTSPRLRRLFFETLFLLDADVRDTLWQRLNSVSLAPGRRLAWVFRRRVFPPRYDLALSAGLGSAFVHDASIVYIIAHELAHVFLQGNALEQHSRNAHAGELAAWQATDDDPSCAECKFGRGLASAGLQEDPAVERAADQQVLYGWGLRPHPDDWERMGLAEFDSRKGNDHGARGNDRDHPA